MTPPDLEKHFHRESMMQSWRLLTPVFSVITTVIVGCFAFFMVRMVNQFDQRNDLILQKMDRIAADAETFKLDIVQKYSEVRYRCCSEIKTYN